MLVPGKDGKVRVLKLNIPYRTDRSYAIKAPTGSGKTSFVILTVFKKCLEEGKKCIYTTSLRLGAQEVYERARLLYGDNVGKIDGSTPLSQRSILWEKPIVLTTFEELVIRMHNLYRMGKKLENTVIVIDEFHNILNTRRKYTLLKILSLCKLWNVPTILLSATFPDARKVAEYLRAIYLDLGSNFQNKEVKRIVTSDIVKAAVNIAAKHVQEGDRVVVFAESKKMLRIIYEIVKRKGIEASLCYRGREGTEEDLKRYVEGRTRLLLATSVVGESMNLPIDVGVVIVNHLTPPWKIVQMIGRVGRYGLTRRAKPVVYLVYSPEHENTVNMALREDYGTIRAENIDDVALTYLLQPLTLEELHNLLLSTFGIERIGIEDTRDCVRRLMSLGLVTESGGLYRTTKVGELLEKYNVHIVEYRTYLTCSRMHSDPLDIAICTCASLGEPPPEASQAEALCREVEEACGDVKLLKGTTRREAWIVALYRRWRPYTDSIVRWVRFHMARALVTRKRLRDLSRCRTVLELLEKYHSLDLTNFAKSILGKASTSTRAESAEGAKEEKGKGTAGQGI